MVPEITCGARGPWPGVDGLISCTRCARHAAHALRFVEIHGPPALTSARYTMDFNETKSMGSMTSATRTADQTIYACVWASSTASYLWNHVALSLMERGRDSSDDDWRHGRPFSPT